MSNTKITTPEILYLAFNVKERGLPETQAQRAEAACDIADRLRVLETTVAMMLAGWGIDPKSTAEEGLLAIVNHVDALTKDADAVAKQLTDAIANHDAERQKIEAKPCVSRALTKLLGADGTQDLIALLNAERLIAMTDKDSAWLDVVEAPDRGMTEDDMREADEAEANHQADLRRSSREG